MSGTKTPRPCMGIELSPRFGLLTLGYLGGIYGLSGLPGFGVRGSEPLVQLTANLFHIPLYAGLTFCFAQAVSGGEGREGVPRGKPGLTFLGTGAYAALDEWHQSFVPGRHSSLSDFLLDLLGVGAMLLILRLGAPSETDPSRKMPE